MVIQEKVKGGIAREGELAANLWQARGQAKGVARGWQGVARSEPGEGRGNRQRP
jgi:hypothetical protein